MKKLFSMYIALVAIFVSGCASYADLYAEYEQGCDLAETIIVYREIDVTKTRWEPAVLFAFDADELSEQAMIVIRNNIEVLNEFTDSLIAVHGSTDDRGSVTYNHELAARRANAVVDYLRAQGVASDRIILGTHNTIAEHNVESIDQRRTLQRRVEMVLLNAQQTPSEVHYPAGYSERFSSPLQP